MELLQKSFIQTKDNNYFILDPDIKLFRGQGLKKNSVTKLCYSSLMKLYFYMYLLKYNGKDEYVKHFIQSLEDYSNDHIGIFNKLPINNGVLAKINFMFKLDLMSTSDDDLAKLQQLDNVIDNIFCDKNIRDFTDIVAKTIKISKDSESVTRNILKHLWKKNYDVVESHESGIDLWRLDRATGERDGIKIKTISENVRYRVKNQSITIEPTLIEISNYNSNFEALPYDYIIFFDRSHKAMNMRTKRIESAPQLHMLKAKAINKIEIQHNGTKRSVKITLRSWAITSGYFSKPYNTYNVPFRFTGKKFS